MSLVRVLVAVLAILIDGALLTLAYAVPGQGPTGNFYDFVPGDFSWPAAQAAALALSHQGQPEYLATVTSAAEDAFLATLAPIGWLVGTDQALEGTWRWANGPEAN
jgi:hypothetical protein